MNKFEIKSFVELENFEGKIKQGNDFIIDLNNCNIKERERVIDFFSGLTFLNGSIKKLSCNEFEVTVNKEA